MVEPSTPLLPTTMVGSYPRPRWFRHQLAGRDVLEAFKDFEHHEGYLDATRCVIHDQEVAGLDVVTDGQMWFDDLHMGIGSFFWYWFERIGGFDRAMVTHRMLDRASGRDAFVMEEAGSARLTGPIEPGPLRMAYMLKCPVLLMVGVYRGGNRYDLYFEELMDMSKADLPRNELIRQAQLCYVARIEHHCRNAPYNWFNFYDFWKP